MLKVSRGALAALSVCSMLAFTAPASAVPITVSQSVTLNQVQPYLTFTNFTLDPSGWSTPFPFTQASQITQIRISFDSLDPNYLAGAGAGFGTFAAIYYVDDAFALHPIASVSHTAPDIFLASAQGAFFTSVRSLLADGLITFAVGAYQSFPDHSAYLTLNGASTLRVDVTGDAPAVVPEPSTILLIGTGLLLILCVPGRSGSILSHLVMTTHDQGGAWIAGILSGWDWLGCRFSAR